MIITKQIEVNSMGVKPLSILWNVLCVIIAIPLGTLQWLFNTDDDEKRDEKRWERDYRHNREDILRESGLNKKEMDKVLEVLDKYHVI